MTRRFDAEILEPAPSLASVLAKKLRQQIEDKRFPLGSAFPSDAEIAKGFGVSRTVVREAVSSLREAGLISTQRGKASIVIAHRVSPGFVVTSDELSSPDRLLQLYRFRTLIETEAAGLAATERTSRDLQLIYDVLDQGEKVDTFEKAIDADVAFHVAIAKATQNEYFERVLATIRSATTARAVLRFDLDGTSYVDVFVSEVQREHADIAEAIRDGDAIAARRSIERHLAGRRYAALVAAAGRRATGGNSKDDMVEGAQR